MAKAQRRAEAKLEKRMAAAKISGGRNTKIAGMVNLPGSMNRRKG